MNKRKQEQQKISLLKTFFNIITFCIFIVGIMTIGVWVHELSHYYELKKYTDINSLSVWCFGDCDGASGWVTYYENAETDTIVAGELKAYGIQAIVVLLLTVMFWKSSFIQNESERT